jgi:hypothetical protein
MAMNDEDFGCQLAATKILGDLLPLNRNAVLDPLLKRLKQLLARLEYSVKKYACSYIDCVFSG